MTKALYRLLACVVFASMIGGLAPAPPAVLADEDARLPAPPQEKVEESLTLVREAYAADYRAAKESEEPEQLITQLAELAEQEADPVKKYALFVEAENVASAHDNYRRAIELLDARAELFRVDGLALKGELLKRLAGPKVSADLELCEQAMDAARQALRSERLELAAETASLAVGIAKAIDREQKVAARKQRKQPGGGIPAPSPIGVDLVKQATGLQSQVTARKKLLDQYLDAVEQVKTAPDSPAANAVVGSYLCFVKEDWKAGLPALAKSNLEKFPEVAADEIKLTADSGPIDAQKGFELAGRWWSAAEGKGVSDEQESAIKAHAAGFYAAVAERLTGSLEKRLAESRLEEQNAGVRTADQDGDSSSPVRQNTVGGLGSSSHMARLSRIEGEGYAVLVQDGIALEGGKAYKFRVRIAGNVALNRADGMPFLRNEGLDVEVENRTSSFRDGWTTCEAAVTPPKDGNYTLGLALYSFQSISMTDISLRAASTGAEVVRNGRFSDGLNGWRTDGGQLTITSFEQQIGSGLKYVMEAEGATITGYTGVNPVVTIPATLKGRPVIAIGYEAFKENATVTRVNLPRGLVRIGHSAFRNCKQLAELVLPEGVRDIAGDAFSGTALKTLTVPVSVQKFAGAPAAPPDLESINVAPGNPSFMSIDGILYDAKGTVVLRCPPNRQKQVVLPKTVRVIGASAFAGCKHLEEIPLPADLEEIGEMAFQLCGNLKSITIPPKVRKIFGQTFQACGALADVSLPEGLEYIGPYVFLGCRKLTTVKLPKSLTSLADNAFQECPAKIERAGDAGAQER